MVQDEELCVDYHNRIIKALVGKLVEYLHVRFAWDIISKVIGFFHL